MFAWGNKVAVGCDARKLHMHGLKDGNHVSLCDLLDCIDFPSAATRQESSHRILTASEIGGADRQDAQSIWLLRLSCKYPRHRGKLFDGHSKATNHSVVGRGGHVLVSCPCVHARLTKCCPITVARNPPDAKLPVSAETNSSNCISIAPFHDFGANLRWR